MKIHPQANMVVESADSDQGEDAGFKTWRNTWLDADLDCYRSLKSAAKRAVAAAKRRQYQDLYNQLDTPIGANKIYRLAKSQQRSIQDIGHAMQVKGANNEVLWNPPAILQPWSDYFASISIEFPHPPVTSPRQFQAQYHLSPPLK